LAGNLKISIHLATQADARDAPSMYADYDDPLNILPPSISILSIKTYSSRQIYPDLSALFSTPHLLRVTFHHLLYLLLSRIDITSDST
jgi:hypothetical protein